MRFYRTDTGQWFATQDQAKAAARAANTRWGPVDVPSDKPGLLAWLAAQAAPSPEVMLGPPPSFPMMGDIAQALGAEPATPVLDAAIAPLREPATPTTRDEVEESIFSGLPLLVETCQKEATAQRREAALAELERRTKGVEQFLPMGLAA